MADWHGGKYAVQPSPRQRPHCVAGYSLQQGAWPRKDQRRFMTSSLIASIYPAMDADFLIRHDIDRIAQLATALRELGADIPMADALEAQVTVLEEARGQYGPASQPRPRLDTRGDVDRRPKRD